MKWLLWLLLIGLGLLWISRSWRSGAAARRAADSPVRTAPAPAEPRAVAAPDLMSACAHCGVHLPRHDAIADAQGQVYCTEAHRRAGSVAAPRGG